MAGATADTRYRYTGREWENEAGLYYYRARYYDPATGRFIGQDPQSFEAGDTNLYRYVGNGPTYATDPIGQTTASLPSASNFPSSSLPRSLSLPKPPPLSKARGPIAAFLILTTTDPITSEEAEQAAIRQASGFDANIHLGTPPFPNSPTSDYHHWLEHYPSGQSQSVSDFVNAGRTQDDPNDLITQILNGTGGFKLKPCPQETLGGFSEGLHAPT